MKSHARLSRGGILNQEKALHELHERIKETFRLRTKGKQEWEDWVKATSELHNYKPITAFLWTDDFRTRLRSSERGAIEDATLFLEIDPWYFGSGYLKEHLLKGLKAAALTENDKERLREVIWKVATGRNRREFRQYCMLAAKVTAPGFIERLSKVTPLQDHESKGKLGYLKAFIEQNGRQQKARSPGNRQ